MLTNIANAYMVQNVYNELENANRIEHGDNVDNKSVIMQTGYKMLIMLIIKRPYYK